MYRIGRNGIALLRQARHWPACLRAMNDQTVLETRDHLNLAADGLLRASRYSSDGGYSISFSLLHGWQRGYVETTGYIIPTMLDLARTLDRPELREDALRQGEWLLQHQRPDGGFPEISRQESAAFDTGQVLMGLTRLLDETGDPRYRAAANAACDWLCGLAQPDGSWRGSVDTVDRCPTYLSRSAAALLRYGKRVGEPRYVVHGRRFLDWTLTQQLPSGLFKGSQLAPTDGYLLHTVVYVLEGLLDGYDDTGEAAYLAAVERGAAPLRDISLHREITLYSHYDEALNPLTDYKCITGLAQWAGVCLRLYRIGGDEVYLKAASNALYYVKSKQLRVDGMLRGALPGSVPIWGEYLKLSYPTWNVKFFADSMLLWTELAEGRAVHQEIYVATSHAISAAKVGWTEVRSSLEASDIRLLERIAATIADRLDLSRPTTIVDLGCGEGRYMQWMRDRFPGAKVLGVDPLPPESSAETLIQGTACRIPLPDESADCIYVSIALQHVDDRDQALAEARRVLRPGGILIVFDRDLLSIRGLMKPWHELRGRWLYGWDAPFRERWYMLPSWSAALRRAGYRVVERRGLSERAGNGLRSRLPINRFIYVAAQRAA